MSDALPLPPQPTTDEYRALAAGLPDAVARGAVRDWATRWIASLAQRTSIGSFGERDVPEERVVDGLEREWQRFAHRQLGLSAPPSEISIDDAQRCVAYLHGFASWPDFAHHVEALSQAGSPASLFETAAGAIVDGDLDSLRGLLRAHPDLVRARSTREHRSTLLHYVSANGVEDFRQKTPPNIVDITTLLLDSGADVNAESEAYGGHSTTLGLAATSIHPETAGVQIPLLELLLTRGANIEQPGQAGNGHSAVVGCLANGQGRAARFLADRGAALDLEGAAGVGNVGVLATFFDANGALTKGATPEQLASGFLYAAGYGREDAVRFLLAHGVDPNTRTTQGQTALHWTTYGPHVGVAELLIAAGTSVDSADRRHRTALDWALEHWANGYGAAERERGYLLIERLIAAGAVPDLTRHDERTQSTLNADARLQKILARR